jgi:hypothetical protein
VIAPEIVGVDVVVAAPEIVAVHVNVNPPVGVILTEPESSSHILATS